MNESLTELQARFIQYLQNTNRSHSTMIAYGKDVEQLVEFMAARDRTAPNEITVDDIESFKEDLKTKRYTGKTISRKINSLKSFFRFLMSESLMSHNPAQEIAHPRFEESPPHALSKLEYRALRDVCRHDVRMYAIVEMLLQTGMRISEISALEMSDLDTEHNIIYIRPQDSRESRRVPLNPAARTALDNYLKVRPRTHDKAVFLTKTCRPFLVRNIRTAIDRYFRVAGIKDSKVNDLRHTFIVEQLKAGTPLVYVSQLVGHKRITTTERYLKMIESGDMHASIRIEEL